MERLNFETLFRVVRWDYNRCFKDESLDKDLFMENTRKPELNCLIRMFGERLKI